MRIRIEENIYRWELEACRQKVALRSTSYVHQGLDVAIAMICSRNPTFAALHSMGNCINGVVSERTPHHAHNHKS